MSIGVIENEPPGVERPASVPRHVPALDGIRGLAILLVMLFHMSVVPPIGGLAEMWQKFVAHGAAGVDVFFVLSGFLITGILLDAQGRPHYFRNFYARRILRIFPLYYAVVIFSLCILPRVAPWTVVKFGQVNHDALWYWLHLSNFAIARRGAFVHGILDVSWSLAIEEQFYLIWPAVVLLARRHLSWIGAALIAMSCVSRLVLTLSGATPVAVYTLTFCRLDGLAIGALLAVRLRNQPSPVKLARLRLLLIAPASLLAVLVLPLPSHWAEARDAAIFGLFVSCLTGCAIAATVVAPREALTRVFSAPLLRALGRYSYALYLFHYPIMAAIRETLLRPTRLPLFFHSSLPAQLAFSIVGMVAAFVAALLSWNLYEKHFLKLKRFF